MKQQRICAKRFETTMRISCGNIFLLLQSKIRVADPRKRGNYKKVFKFFNSIFLFQSFLS